MIDTIKKTKYYVIDTETTSKDANTCKLLGVSLSNGEKSSYHLADDLDFVRVLNEQGVQWIGQNIKYDYKVLKRHGIELKNIYFDTAIAHHLIDPIAKHNLDDLSLRYLEIQKTTWRDLYESVGKNNKDFVFSDLSYKAQAKYSREDAECTYQLYEKFKESLEEKNLIQLFNLEMSLVKLLADMELRGIKIDLVRLKELQDRLEEKAEYAEKMFYKKAGKKVNPRSPKQLQELFFTDLGVKPFKKTKTGQNSTDGDCLKVFAANGCEAAKILLEYRELTKMLSTYIRPYTESGKDTIHTTFNQLVVPTGRLSSSKPNLQNIPVKSDIGREIRACFVARPGHKFVSADYSQIELRVLAHLSKDKNLIDAFGRNADIHKSTASLLNRVPIEEVTEEMRYAAKTINFSMIYGKGVRNLARDLGKDEKETKTFYNRYFLTFPRLKEYFDYVISLCRVRGYLRTRGGRYLMIPDIKSKDQHRKAFAERCCKNYPIQGSAQDLIKKAMLKLPEHLKNKLILQIHDELIFEVPEEEVESDKRQVKACMEGVGDLVVPLVVNVKVSKRWEK